MADTIDDGIQRNFRLSKNAGDARPPGLDPLARGEADPDTPMEPLADFTIRQRVKEGIGGTRPLIATGQFMNEVGPHSAKKMSVRVGPKTPYAKRIALKQLGTFDTGIKSDITRSDIPARVVVGYGPRERKLVIQRLKDVFRIGSGAKGTVTVSIGL